MEYYHNGGQPQPITSDTLLQRSLDQLDPIAVRLAVATEGLKIFVYDKPHVNLSTTGHTKSGERLQ